MTSRTDSSATARQAADMMEQNYVPLTRDWRGRIDWQEFFEKSNGERRAWRRRHTVRRAHSGLLAHAIASSAARGHTLIPKAKDVDVPEASDEDFKRFFVAALDWLETRGPVALGSVALPREICGASLDALFDYIVTMADRVGAVHDGQDDLRFLENLVAVGVVLAPHTRHPNDDLLLLRVSAGKSVSAARMQRGRDWAEHALNMVNGDTLRARLAWFAFADVYWTPENARFHSLLAIPRSGPALTKWAEVRKGPNPPPVKSTGYARTNQEVDFQHRQAKEPAPIRRVENAVFSGGKVC